MAKINTEKKNNAKLYQLSTTNDSM